MLKDNKLNEFLDSDILELAGVDAQILDAWKKNVAKPRRILLEGVRDHIVSSLHGKVTPYAMCKALTGLFQNNNDQRKFALKDKLRKIKKDEGETVPTYLAKFTQCRDEIGSVGVTIFDDELVNLALLGLPKS